MKRRAPLKRGKSLVRVGFSTTPKPLRANTELKRGGKLRPRSVKTERVYREQRRPLVAALLAEPTICPVPDCTNVADSPHEPLTRARGGSITDPSNVVAICWFHNEQISAEEPPWAYDLGLLRHSWDKDGAA